MTARRTSALLGGMLVAAASMSGRAQDAPQARTLAMDSARIQPVYRTYDMIIHRADSATVIGQSVVALMPASHAGADAWRLVETRSGAVRAADSLWFALDGRPLSWSSTVGPAQLTAQFVGDSIFGAATAGRARNDIVMEGHPDLLVTGAFTSVMLGWLPLSESWSDSVTVLEIDLAKASVIPAEMIVAAMEELLVDAVTPRPAWVVALRTAQRQSLFWVDRETGVVLRIQENLPSHIGTMLEYRIHPIPRLRLPRYWP
ncbi:MAG: hypothetical protein WD801_05180 [Gemmatimonadaceae bacterium]